MNAPIHGKDEATQERSQATSSIESQLQVDRICTSFETQWQDEHGPSIEDLIAENPQIDSRWLLKELLPIELELCARSGKQANIDDYLQRFENDRDIVESVSSNFMVEFPDKLDDTSGSPRYVRRAELARGGMGIVYEGWDRVLLREVAIKVIDQPLSEDWEARVRFQREPRICGSLQHPNIIPIYDVGTTKEGSAFFVMKRIHGQTLDKWLDEPDKSIALEQKLETFLSVARAVASAHRKSIVHRDIKPSNIMIADFGEVYVMDWGLAGGDSKSLAPSELSNAPGLTSVEPSLKNYGTMFGTPEYMAPEQHKDSDKRTQPQVDVYSLGALLCWMLIGKSPRIISGGASRGIVNESAADLVDTTAALKSSGIDSLLSEIVSRCIASAPEERYPSASELVVDVEAYQSRLAESARDAQRRADVAVHQTKMVRLRWQSAGVACV
jgi:eukaryotic-like serine/threonine-protein kinase